MGFAMEVSTEWKMGGGAHSTHSSPTVFGLGICAPPTHPNFSEFFLFGTGRGAQKCFIVCDQTSGDLKSHHLQARVTLTALSVPSRPHFLSVFFLHFLGTDGFFGGGGGGARAPLPPPPWVRHCLTWVQIDHAMGTFAFLNKIN